MEKTKIITQLKLNQPYELDKGFFIIEKQEITDISKRKYIRYFLKTIASPKQMKELTKYIKN